jgi:hypothetical protein
LIPTKFCEPLHVRLGSSDSGSPSPRFQFTFAMGETPGGVDTVKSSIAAAADSAAAGEVVPELEGAGAPEQAASTNVSAETVPTRAGRRPTNRMLEMDMMSPGVGR